MKLRKPKLDDQEKAQEAFHLLILFLQSHQFEGTIWIAAMSTAIAENFYKSNLSYKEYCKEMEEMAKNYKYFWDEED